MMNMYIKPVITIIKVNKEDIIKTSGPTSATDALFGPGKGGVKL